MKTQFTEYYQPTEEQFKTLWENCVFAIDANVLLNVYGYSEATREQLLSLLASLSERIRMPYQFALEYQRNRAHAIMEQVKNYAKVERILNNLHDDEFRPKTKHPFLSARALNLFEVIRRELTKSRKQHESLFAQDPYFNRITMLASNVSEKPTDDELRKLYEKAKLRYALRIPPGYEDLKEKGEPGAYGDFIGWTQMMEIAKTENKPMILLTDDAKGDWWQIQSDRTIGPRPELIAEFRFECATGFYMYSSDHFMRLAGKYLKQNVQEAAIEEVSQRLSTQLREAASVKSEAKSQGESVISEKPFFLPESSQLEDLKATEVQSVAIEKSSAPTS